MLHALAKHAGWSLRLRSKGDLLSVSRLPLPFIEFLLIEMTTVDDHHTTEDTFLALGSAFTRALGPRAGIARFGSAYAPLDEALSRAVLDISSRPFFVGEFGFAGPMIGNLNSQMIHHGLASWAQAANVTLHVDVIRGTNDHHRAESAFKALALACKDAAAKVKGKEGEVGSTKGVLESGFPLTSNGIPTQIHKTLSTKDREPDVPNGRLAPSSSNSSSAYALAGVSISAGNDLVQRIKPHVASTAIPGTSATIGGFGGVFDLSLAGYTSLPTLIGAIDGVGTKLKIAHAMNKHDTVGIDLVAMNVNDLVVQGARPLFFLDCFSCGRLDLDAAESFVKGVTVGCKEAGCALIGGETAEMPGIFAEAAYDVAGAAIGGLARGQKLLPDKSSMEKGDVLLALRSSGCHSNGFTLIRSILENAGLTYEQQAPWEHGDKTVGESLLTPTKIYAKSLTGVINKGLLKGMAHITGGGLIENIPRMLPKHLAVELDVSTWPLPEVMKWLKVKGNLPDDEFATVFNTGIGMVMVVGRDDVELTVSVINHAGEKVDIVGEVIERKQNSCVLRNLSCWNR